MLSKVPISLSIIEYGNLSKLIACTCIGMLSFSNLKNNAPCLENQNSYEGYQSQKLKLVESGHSYLVNLSLQQASLLERTKKSKQRVKKMKFFLSLNRTLHQCLSQSYIILTAIFSILHHFSCKHERNNECILKPDYESKQQSQINISFILKLENSQRTLSW